MNEFPEFMQIPDSATLERFELCEDILQNQKGASINGVRKNFEFFDPPLSANSRNLITKVAYCVCF